MSLVLVSLSSSSWRLESKYTGHPGRAGLQHASLLGELELELEGLRLRAEASESVWDVCTA